MNNSPAGYCHPLLYPLIVEPELVDSGIVFKSDILPVQVDMELARFYC